MKIIVYLLLSFSFIYSQCADYSNLECDNAENCEWVEDIQIEWCSFDDASTCNSIPGCEWDCDSWYTWLCGCDGQYQVDNSYCQEIQMPECSDMNELQCDEDHSCDWIENIDAGSCSSLSLSDCDLPEYGSCYSDCTNWGSYYNGMFCYGTMYCAGGNYQIDNSYCEEVEYQLGDVNQDDIINIQDVIIVINLILNIEFDIVADINSDDIVNVLDVIQLIDLILN